MSLRLFSNISGRLRVPAFVLGVGLCGAAFAAPPVQTYADQAMPTQVPQSQQYYDSPLAAGTLTLQDVLEAHPNAPAPLLPTIGAAPAVTATAPLLAPPVQSSSTSLMMSQGMKDVLQKVAIRLSHPSKRAILMRRAKPKLRRHHLYLQPMSGRPRSICPA